MSRSFTAVAAFAAFGPVFAFAAPADDVIDYTTQIKPVLQARCYACHGALKQKAGLRLDTVALARKGGDSGPAITPGDVEASVLFERVSSADESERMPPEGEPLAPSEIAALRAWIAQGATAPEDEEPERDPRDHWAFRTPVRPPVPAVLEGDWASNPIDAFLAAKHHRRGLTPQPTADPRVWLRRVSLDLVGLPPSLEEQDAFIADHSAEAYERVVDRLLASPLHGERWGRHWMDIWRYSDWWGLGAEVRNSQKHIWHWRDWIVESLNADKGYDQMLREMLAADELYPNDLDRLRATGFLARSYFKFNRTSWLDETIEHTAKAMLGLTLNCAKCHDHKYDPISQEDYYRVRAIFEPYQLRTEAIPGEIDFEKDGIPRAFDCNLDAPTYVHIRGDDRNPDTSRVIQPGLPAFLTFRDLEIAPIDLPAEAVEPGLRPFVVEAHIASAERRIAEARTAWESALGKRIEAAVSLSAMPFVETRAATLASNPAEGPLSLDQAEALVVVATKALAAAEAQMSSIRARAAADSARHQQPPPDNLAALTAEASRAERIAAVAQADENLSRAELERLQATPEKAKDAEAKRTAARTALETARKALSEEPGRSYTPLIGALKTLESNLETEESRRKPFPKVSSGRRTAPARWITDPKNPLTARVAVNHVWTRHFGRPLVPTVFDFGRKGTPPTHPELLDWLAVELIESGWSLKHLHRLIVTSKTYRLSSTTAGASEQTRAADPDNRDYWRANSIRMEAQVIRDSLLSLAGVLDQAQGGPSIPIADESSRRRSLYFIHSHNEHQKFLAMFDDASVLECYRRTESVVPQQALALENSPLALSMAERIARQLTAACGSVFDSAFLRSAFRAVLCVEPSDAEQTAAAEALGRLTEAAVRSGQPDPQARARTLLVLALINHNDFITIR